MRCYGLACFVLALAAQIALPQNAVAEASGGRAEAAFAAWTLRLAGGAGIGGRELELPADGVVYVTRTGLFPAIDLGFELDHHVSPKFHLGLHARYQTSIGLQIAEQHPGGSERVQRLRSHRLELAIAAALDLDDARRWAILVRLGCGVVDLRPESHVFTPGYFLAGPYARAELQLPLGVHGLHLRLGPEAQWIVLVGRELPHRGIGSEGVGIGGVASIELQLGDRWTLDASYRELRVWLASSQPESLVDVSRFITAGLTGSL